MVHQRQNASRRVVATPVVCVDMVVRCFLITMFAKVAVGCAGHCRLRRLLQRCVVHCRRFGCFARYQRNGVARTKTATRYIAQRWLVAQTAVDLSVAKLWKSDRKFDLVFCFDFRFVQWAVVCFWSVRECGNMTGAGFFDFVFSFRFLDYDSWIIIDLPLPEISGCPMKIRVESLNTAS